LSQTMLWLIAVVVAVAAILPPPATTGKHVGLVFVGRNDTSSDSYLPLVKALQTAALPSLSVWVDIRADLSNVAASIASLKNNYQIESIFMASHSMTPNAGVAVQEYARNNSAVIQGIVMLAGFLQRTQRLDVRTCLTKAAVQPKKSLKCPLGCLEDGAHTCTGSNLVDFPVPALTVAGELDGVVRITRVAEAFYTQAVLRDDTAKYPVVVVAGMNHASLLSTSLPTPPAVAKRDLKAEVQPAAAVKTVATAVAQFLGSLAMSSPEQLSGDGLLDPGPFFAPVIEAFVKQEANWMWTGGDDEHGSSPWAANAQKLLASPLPHNYAWTTANEFHLLADEDKLPPYYRHKHRASANFSAADSSFHSSTVAQLRFLEVTPTQTKAGLDGDEVIKEEKLNVLSAFPDDGDREVSAIEIATKMVSRQKIFNISNNLSPDTLDSGDLCKFINEQAYNWALSTVSTVAQQRFNQSGIPFTMAPDVKPFPPAGPWFIWSYLKFTPSPSAVSIASIYAFYSLSAPAYGAGTHYCKLLSPARALEWIMVDSLRK